MQKPVCHFGGRASSHTRKGLLMNILREWGDVRCSSLDKVISRITFFKNFASTENIKEGVSLDEMPERFVPDAAFKTGWHLYGYLCIAEFLFNENNAAGLLAHIYDNLGKAATYALKECASRSRLLEHQGQMLHFYIDALNDDTGTAVVKGFAQVLNRAVVSFVFDHYSRKQGIGDFTMAAQHGSAIIMYIPPATAEGAVASRISLGKCANDPARCLLNKAYNLEPWHFHYRKSESHDWTSIPCLYTPSDVGDSAKYANFGSLENLKDSINHTVSMPKRNANSPVLRCGYVFKADLDDFTKHVATAFSADRHKHGNPNGMELVREFISFVKAINKWQIEGGGKEFNFAPAPWAGDCCTMAVFLPFKDQVKAILQDDPLSLQQFRDVPKQLMEAWDGFLRPYHYSSKFSKWSCSLSFGKIAFFDTTVGNEDVRMLAGMPIMVSNIGVNLSTTAPGDLVMKQHEIELINSDLARTFKKLMGYGYVGQQEDMREGWS